MPAARELPRGTVTFLFSDIEGSTRLLHELRERYAAVLGGRAPARVLLEATTESEWVARHLESLGHEVVVADPNYAPMYGARGG